MKSIFNADGNAELATRINKLRPDAKALWGKMDAAQMMTHCVAGISIAFGLAKCHRHWVGRLFGSISKRRMLKVETFDRHMPAYIDLRIEYSCNFDEAKKNLLSVIELAYQKGEAGLVKYPHPYFGRFKPGEWRQLNWKHLDHHLSQFGV